MSASAASPSSWGTSTVTGSVARWSCGPVRRRPALIRRPAQRGAPSAPAARPARPSLCPWADGSRRSRRDAARAAAGRVRHVPGHRTAPWRESWRTVGRARRRNRGPAAEHPGSRPAPKTRTGRPCRRRASTRTPRWSPPASTRSARRRAPGRRRRAGGRAGHRADAARAPEETPVTGGDRAHRPGGRRRAHRAGALPRLRRGPAGLRLRHHAGRQRGRAHRARGRPKTGAGRHPARGDGQQRRGRGRARRHPARGHGRRRQPAAAAAPTSLAGKLLRIDPFGRPAPGTPDPASPVVGSGLHAPGDVCADRRPASAGSPTGPARGTSAAPCGPGSRPARARPPPRPGPGPSDPGSAGCAALPGTLVVGLRGSSGDVRAAPRHPRAGSSARRRRCWRAPTGGSPAPTSPPTA